MVGRGSEGVAAATRCILVLQFAAINRLCNLVEQVGHFTNRQDVRHPDMQTARSIN